MKAIIKSIFARKIRFGPFSGMRYIPCSHGSVLMPKVLGIYEKEIRDLLRDRIDAADNCITVIGAAEGYYSVGCLFRNKRIRSIAFEEDDQGRALMKKLAVKNGVMDRLEIRGRCDPAILRSVVSEHHPDLLIIDVEGYERSLLVDSDLPELKSQAMVVELHGFEDADIERSLTDKFKGSHQTKLIKVRTPRIEDIEDGLFRWVASRSRRARHAFLWERQLDLGWLALTPKSASGDS